MVFFGSSLYLILAEKLFTLPAANEMLLSALFAGKSREVGLSEVIGNRAKGQFRENGVLGNYTLPGLAILNGDSLHFPRQFLVNDPGTRVCSVHLRCEEEEEDKAFEVIQDLTVNLVRKAYKL